MKRFLVTIATLVLSVVCLTGCSSYSKMDKAYVKIGDEWKTIAVKDVSEYSSGMFQLTLQDGTVLFIHATNCILYEGNLPLKK